MKLQPSTMLIAMALGASALLSACGGGGGSAESTTSPPPASALIGPANSHEVGATGYSAAQGLNGQVDGSAGVVTGVTVSGPASGLLGHTLQQLYRGLAVAGGPALVVGVSATRTVPCPQGGQTQVTTNIASLNGLSSGDSLSLVANNCRADGVTLNGGLTIGFAAVSGMPLINSAWSGTFNATFTGFSQATSSETATANGDMSITLTQSSARNASFSASGNSLKMSTTRSTGSSETTLTNYRYAGAVVDGVVSYGVNFTMTSTAPKLGTTSYAVKTSIDFRQNPGAMFPSQGAMTVTASDRTSVTLTVVDASNVTIGLDRNGDGTVDETSTLSWAALMARL